MPLYRAKITSKDGSLSNHTLRLENELAVIEQFEKHRPEGSTVILSKFLVDAKFLEDDPKNEVYIATISTEGTQMAPRSQIRA